MKKAIVLLCMFTCLWLLSGCANDKNDTKSSSVSGQTEGVITSATMPEQDDVPFVQYESDDDSDGITVEFKDPNNSDGIEVTKKLGE